MSSSWVDVTLGDVLTLQRGFDLPQSERRDGPFPVIASTGEVGRHNEAKVAAPGVVIGRSGSLGGGQYVQEDYWPLNTTLWVKDFKGNDPRFCYYLIKSLDFSSYNAGSGVPTLNRNHIHPLPVRIPSDTEEQRAIAEVLGVLDDKIELNERINTTLDEMARTLFKSWFVDFDPVRAKAEGRQPSHMDAATAALFPASFEDSPLGPIPAGWRVEAIGNLSEVNGWTLGKNDELETIDYIEISEVSRGNIGSIQRYQRGTEPSRARRRLRHGDTALSTVRPDRGAYFLALNPSPTAIASTGFAVLSPSTAPWSYVHAAMTQEDVFERLGHLADGAAYPAVRPDVVAQTPVVWGGEEVGDAFHRQIAPLYELAAHNREESGTLAELRDTLLPRLISGEIRVEASTGIGRAC